MAGAHGRRGGLNAEESALASELIERCTFPPPGTAVSCAVSGGADSSALLVLAVVAGCMVTAIHVDHGLRPDSAGEADQVAALAARFGAGFLAATVNVEPGPNLEARCRAARREVLPTGVLTGHTADDQAETVLLNLLRGSGLDGLAGMRPAGHPLLGLRRAETQELCRLAGIDPVRDPTNESPVHRRNRVRHELVPLLDAIAERDVRALLARQAGHLADEADLLDELAAGLDPTDARALASAPVALARRAVRHWLADPRPPDAATVERVLSVARGDHRACELAGGGRVERHRQRLVLFRP